MKKYNKDDIEIFKRAIKDYNELKIIIDTLIKGGYTIEDLYDFVGTKLSETDITNYEDLDDFKYIDFNYKDMCVSILKHDNNGIYLGETIEIWNDKKFEYIGTFNNTRELEDFIRESENK